MPCFSAVDSAPALAEASRIGGQRVGSVDESSFLLGSADWGAVTQTQQAD
jgi:hypothetical protein